MNTTVQKDVITTRKGEKLSISFLDHASLAIQYGIKTIYIDPVGMYADYSASPKADVILITHQHDDHFDKAVVDLLSKPTTEILSIPAVISSLGKGKTMKNGDRIMLGDWLVVEATPAYNITPGHEAYHPKGAYNGYLLTLAGMRIYIAGDTEPTDEMLKLRDIDIAFLPVNQPYTMTVDQVVKAAKTIKPKILYPYHYGRTDHKTDIQKVAGRLAGTGIDVRIRDME